MPDPTTPPVTAPRTKQSLRRTPHPKRPSSGAADRRSDSKPPKQTMRRERSAFRKSGKYGSPRLIAWRGRTAGLGFAFGAQAAYISSWKKGMARQAGMQGIFTVGLKGIDFTGGRKHRRYIFLLGLHAGLGIATLYRQEAAGREIKQTEYMPHAGLDLHTVSLFNAFSLYVAGGYCAILAKDDGTEKFLAHHGGYARIGAEFFVDSLGRYLSPVITVTYAYTRGGRHDLIAGAGLRY